MSTPGQMIRQRDFSAGELVEYAKHADDNKVVRGGARRMQNWRCLNTGALEQRPGRVALFPESGRTDEVRVNSSTIYRISFGEGTLRIRDANGVVVAACGGFPWTIATRDQVTWALVNFDVVICYPGMRTKIARWDGVSSWSFLDYTFRTGADGVARVPFYRLAAKGITMLPGGITGSVAVQFSANVLLAGHVGTVFQWANRRLQITAVADGQNGTATCLESLYPCQRLTVPAGNELNYNKGDVIIGSITNANGVVTSIDAVNHYVFVQNLTMASGFTTSDTIVSPTARSSVSAAAVVLPQATEVWSEQVISDVRGWPQSVSTDVNRLIFCDLPAVPDGIIYSSVGIPDDLQIGGNATDAFMEIMTGKPRIYHVIGGSDQFVFTNKGVRYIPISASNPLKPGSVQFLQIDPDACAPVRPVPTSDGVLYLNEGRSRVIAVIPTGQQTTPWATQDISEFHAHLIKTPIALATSTGDGEFPEKYIYLLNSDGTITIGRYNRAKEWVGFMPWRSRGYFEWISILASRVLVTTRYRATPGVTADTTLETADADDLTADFSLVGDTASYRLVELVSSRSFLDGAVLLNGIPAPLAAGTDPVFPIFVTAGTAIGDMTAGGGLNAASDGVLVQPAAACAGRASTSGFYGRALPVAQPIGRADVWPSSDSGFGTAISGAVTLELRGSNTLPTLAGDGTLLGQLATANVTAGPLSIPSNDLATAYRYVWVRVFNGSATNVYLAQGQFYAAGQVRASATGATGPLWFYSGMSVDVMRAHFNQGSRAVDITGNIVPEEGDDLTSPYLTIGMPYSLILEPFVPNLDGGQDVGQSTKRRSIKRALVAYQRSSGFVFAGRRVTAWRQGEDQGVAPPLREGTESFRPLGRAYDPRVTLLKDTPGPLRVLEVGLQVGG